MLRQLVDRNELRRRADREWLDVRRSALPGIRINSGATIDITSDDFTNGTVVASGSPSATISLINNFWGTINPTQIAAKITDNANNPNLPNVTYEPFLSENRSEE